MPGRHRGRGDRAALRALRFGRPFPCHDVVGGAVLARRLEFLFKMAPLPLPGPGRSMVVAMNQTMPPSGLARSGTNPQAASVNNLPLYL